MTAGPALCGVCRRFVQLRKDGKLRAHLSARSTAERQEQCGGSGMVSARVEMSRTDGPVRSYVFEAGLSSAAEFNAIEEWHLADSLYNELEAMKACGREDTSSYRDTQEALGRALASARRSAQLTSYGRTRMPASAPGGRSSGRQRQIPRPMPFRYLR